MYTVHLILIGKLVVDFLFALIKLFLLGIMATALREHIDWRSEFLKWVGQLTYDEQCTLPLNPQRGLKRNKKCPLIHSKPGLVPYHTTYPSTLQIV